MSTDVLSEVTKCPHCHSETALCFYKSTHLRWCVSCNVSFTVIYNKKASKYKRSEIREGLVFP